MTTTSELPQSIQVKKLALGRWNGGVETMHVTSIRFATGNMSTFVDEDKAKARTIETKIARHSRHPTN